MSSPLTRQIVWFCTLWVGVQTVCVAQSPLALRPGARIRVSLAHQTQLVTGHVLRLTDDSLELSADDRVYPLALREIQELEVHRGHDNALFVGAAGGFLGGAAVGVVLGMLVCVDGCEGGASHWDETLGIAARLGGVGLAIGTVAGAISVTGVWQRVNIRPLVERGAGTPKWGLTFQIQF